MYTLTPGQAIKIKDTEQLDRLGSEISERLDLLEQLNAPLFEDIRIWWQQYEAVPRLKQKNFPFRNSSNVVIPLTKIQSEAMIARTMDKVFAEGHRVWDVRTENEGHEDLARNMVRYMNWQADDNDFDFRASMEDWLREFIVIGSAVFAGHWREVRGNVFMGIAGGKTKLQKIQYYRGPVIEHAPRHLIQWDHSQTIQETDMVSRQYDLMFGELMQRAMADPESWSKENLQKVRGAEGSTGPAENVREALAEMDSQQRKKSEGHDIREVHIRWPLQTLTNLRQSDLFKTNGRSKKADEQEFVDLPIVATVHRRTRKILRLVAQPYHIAGFPFFEGYYSKRPGRGHSVGAAKELEQLQLAYTTIFNQGIDAQTRANSVWAKTRDPRHLDQPIDPQVPVYDPAGTFEPLKIPGVDFSNFNLLQFVQSVAERLTGQGDAQFGRETRMGGHPSPAHNVMMMDRNAEMLLAPRHGQVARVLARVGMFVAVIDQQFETNEDGRLTRVLGDIDGEQVGAYLFPKEPIPGNYLFSVKGLSRALNSQTRFDRSMQLFQIQQQYWASIVAATKALAETLQMPLPPEIKEAQGNAYMQFFVSQNETYKDLLQAADVDDVEKFLFSIENFVGDTSDAVTSFIDRAQRANAIGPGGAQGDQAGADVAGAGAAAPFAAGGTTGLPQAG